MQRRFKCFMSEASKNSQAPRGSSLSVRIVSFPVRTYSHTGCLQTVGRIHRRQLHSFLCIFLRSCRGWRRRDLPLIRRKNDKTFTPLVNTMDSPLMAYYQNECSMRNMWPFAVWSTHSRSHCLRTGCCRNICSHLAPGYTFLHSCRGLEYRTVGLWKPRIEGHKFVSANISELYWL